MIEGMVGAATVQEAKVHYYFLFITTLDFIYGPHILFIRNSLPYLGIRHITHCLCIRIVSYVNVQNKPHPRCLHT